MHQTSNWSELKKMYSNRFTFMRSCLNFERTSIRQSASSPNAFFCLPLSELNWPLMKRNWISGVLHSPDDRVSGLSDIIPNWSDRKLCHEFCSNSFALFLWGNLFTCLQGQNGKSLCTFYLLWKMKSTLYFSWTKINQINHRLTSEITWNQKWIDVYIWHLFRYKHTWNNPG